MFPYISVIGPNTTFNDNIVLLIDIIQNKRTYYHIYLENILKESGRIISYRFINLIVIVFIETTNLIKSLMVQPSKSVS